MENEDGMGAWSVSARVGWMYDFEGCRDDGLIRYDLYLRFHMQHATCNMHVHLVAPNVMSLSGLIYKTLP